MCRPQVHPTGSSLISHLSDTLTQLFPSTTFPGVSLVVFHPELVDLEWRSKEWALASQALESGGPGEAGHFWESLPALERSG